jgi:DNA-directed RNA polymerase specialized sigma24 family protein
MHIEPIELKLAERVAQRIGSKWSAVEIDDLTSHLYLWLCTNEKALLRWRDEVDGEGKLYVSLRREAAKYSAKEQAARVGRPISAGNFYTADVLVRAMPFVFEETPQTTVVENMHTGEAQYSGGEHNLAVAIMADIRGAFHGLNREVKQVLEWRFRDGLTLEEIGELKSISKVAAGKQVDRAISRLVDALAGERI